MKLYTILLLTVIFSIASNGQEKHNVHSIDKPSTHGMLIFGKNKLYAYHLPMFHSPHDYQIIQLTHQDYQAYFRCFGYLN